MTKQFKEPQKLLESTRYEAVSPQSDTRLLNQRALAEKHLLLETQNWNKLLDSDKLKLV